uniref:Putative lipocalin-5 1 n=1 Tax=Hyalomma excavatum TaxID=257692 RepID=A0A131XKT4_9ACAR
MAWLKLAIGIIFLGLATATPVPSQEQGTPQEQQHQEQIDVFRMIGAFPKVVAFYTSRNDSSFKCLSAVLTAFNAENKTATYVWPRASQGNGERRNVTFTISAGDVHDQTKYFVDDDTSRVYKGYHHYTDYQNCMVMTLTYRDHDHCLLWVKRSVAHAVPQNCLDNYEANCDVRVPTFDNDLCHDDEGHES